MSQPDLKKYSLEDYRKDQLNSWGSGTNLLLYDAAFGHLLPKMQYGQDFRGFAQVTGLTNAAMTRGYSSGYWCRRSEFTMPGTHATMPGWQDSVADALGCNPEDVTVLNSDVVPVATPQGGQFQVKPLYNRASVPILSVSSNPDLAASPNESTFLSGTEHPLAKRHFSHAFAQAFTSSCLNQLELKPLVLSEGARAHKGDAGDYIEVIKAGYAPVSEDWRTPQGMAGALTAIGHRLARGRCLNLSDEELFCTGEAWGAHLCGMLDVARGCSAQRPAAQQAADMFKEAYSNSTEFAKTLGTAQVNHGKILLTHIDQTAEILTTHIKTLTSKYGVNPDLHPMLNSANRQAAIGRKTREVSATVERSAI